jgi:hypothetical protein
MRALTDEKSDFAVGIEEAIDDALAAAGRQIDRQTLPAEERLDRREQAGQIGVLGVDLVDDDEAAETAFCRPVHHPRGDHLDAGLRADDDRRGLHGVERADRLAEKVRKSGVSIRWTRVSCVSRCTTDARSECCHDFSSGSKSLTVVPRSTVPASLIAPDASSSASASVLLPDPP